MSKPITLESNPIEKDYEDYICAYFQAGGLYVEKSIIHRETEEILELDIITTNFSNQESSRKLIEIKSAGWGFSEVFKVKGWLAYLKMEKGIFIVKKHRDSLDYFKAKAADLGIDLIHDSDLAITGKLLSSYLLLTPKESEVKTLRFAYLLERKLLKSIKDLKKEDPENQGYKNLDDLFFKVNSGSFFSNNPIRRIRQLFELFVKYKNLTAKLCHELETGKYDDDIEELSGDGFKSLFYEVENTPLQIGLYLEHMSRITILKTCIEHLLRSQKEAIGTGKFSEKIDFLNIPNTIKNGLSEIVQEPYFHRYPIFWQFFTYVMGGFILTDLRASEYEYISANTGIPVDEIPRAFESYNKLFPKAEGWLFKLPNSNIEWHRFFPLPFCGTGANHRRFIHLTHLPEADRTFEELAKLVTGNKTMSDLIKWNNLAYEILK